jgi:CubicO group peptidase (beta-lactamase class C family)
MRRDRLPNRLVEQGKIKLDAKLSDYLPDAVEILKRLEKGPVHARQTN